MDDTKGGEDRVTEVRIAGARCIDELVLPLRGVHVLIGPNGAGKSTILECLELLRIVGATRHDEFARAFEQDHGGLGRLLRRGAVALRLGVTIEGAGDPVRYDFTVRRNGVWAFSVAEEKLDLFGRGYAEPLHVIERQSATDATFFAQLTSTRSRVPNVHDRSLAVHAFGEFPPNAAIRRLLDTLAGIDVHVPFDVRPLWSSPHEIAALRQSNVIRPAHRLERFGANLANAYHQLKNLPDVWPDCLIDIRAGLGSEILDVGTDADPGGGQIALVVRYRSGEIPAFGLSDGSLAYLAFVALRHLPRRDARPLTLLAFDEPELHLHPELLARVVGFFEELGEGCPVVLASHSDRVLDLLQDPASAATLCELGPDRTTRLLRPDPDRLHEWLQHYRGLGQLRAEGLESVVFARSLSGEEE